LFGFDFRISYCRSRSKSYYAAGIYIGKRFHVCRILFVKRNGYQRVWTKFIVLFLKWYRPGIFSNWTCSKKNLGKSFETEIRSQRKSSDVEIPYSNFGSFVARTRD